MKYGILDYDGTLNCLIDHNVDCVPGDHEDVEALISSGVIVNPAIKKTILNTCVGVQNYYLKEDLRKALHEHWKLTGPANSTIYSLFNGKDFSDWLEVSFSSRFMNDEVGPCIGFSTGTALRVQAKIKEAVPQVALIQEFLQEIDYRGEILLGLTDSFTLSRADFGHFYGHFAMFCEMIKTKTTQDCFEFLLGNKAEIGLHESIAVSSLVSKPPFPSPVENSRITAPQSAEKHLWRFRQGKAEVVLAAVHGTYLGEARKRLRRTLENMVQYYPLLQFRTDYGFRQKFVLEADRYQEFVQNKGLKNQNSTLAAPSGGVEPSSGDSSSAKPSTATTDKA